MPSVKTKKRCCGYVTRFLPKNTPWPNRWPNERPTKPVELTKRWLCTRRNSRAVGDLLERKLKSDEGYVFHPFASHMDCINDSRKLHLLDVATVATERKPPNGDEALTVPEHSAMPVDYTMPN